MGDIKKPHILLVDDEIANLNILEGCLIENDYIVFCGKSAKEALVILKQDSIDLILLDINMPGMDGFELCTKLKKNKRTKDIPIIFLTGQKGSEYVAKGLELGAADYLGKPVHEVELLARVRNHLKLKDFQFNLEELVKQRTLELNKEIKQREKTEIDLEKSNVKLQELMQDNLNLLASVVEIRDPYTAGHQQNVTKLAMEIASAMELEKDVFDAIKVAATIHDIGKIKIPLEILSKGGKLLEVEMKIIRTHPITGYELLKDINFPWPIADIVLQHHERIDGSGYPYGIMGKEIKFEAKLLGLADVIEAVTYHRPYRAGLGIDRAIKEIKSKKGILFEPELVDIAVNLVNKGFNF